ncbi:hypothetical protein LSCM4_04388 [Leishmania orientalis]|uniref:Uncharacterized protein n=1 Tax=Leishmania orientalis TaxID=2249476 RepID=A0A836KK27_9TRYP|nr:hypothetical protein LSCM4_04388 [Leishmania orientalis]
MKGQPHIPLNGREMRRQMHTYHHRQWQYCYVARFVIRLSIWLLGAYLMSERHPRALEAYLVLSMTLMAWILFRASGEEEEEEERERKVSAHECHDGVQAKDEDSHLALRSVGSSVRQPSAPEHTSFASTREKPSSAESDKDGAASSSTSLFTGVVTPSQQRVLLLELKEFRTTGATRCAMDVAFRRQLVETELEETAICMCGSGEAFGSCCASVKDILLRVLDMTERRHAPSSVSLPPSACACHTAATRAEADEATKAGE